MEQLWVAILTVSTALSASGSVLHGVASGSGYPQLIPYEVAFTNVHSPLVLSQLHGLRIDEALASQTNTHAPAPVIEASSDEISNNNLITEQLYEQILGAQAGADANNAIQEGAISRSEESGSVSLEAIAPGGLATSLVQPETPPSPTVGDLILPKTGSEAQIITSDAPVPLPTTPSQGGELSHPEVIPTQSGSGVIINAEHGKLQMQASLVVSGGEALQVSAEDIPQTGVDSVLAIIPELPASENTKGLKKSPGGVGNVNVNVNVNINGDGTGSVINSTSVAEITAPIKTGHIKCD